MVYMYVSRNVITITYIGVIKFLTYFTQFVVSVWYPASVHTMLSPMFLHKQILLIVLN